MHKQKSFPLRIGDQERRPGAQAGIEDGSIRESSVLEPDTGLPVREQMAYFEKLRAKRVPAREGLALLGQAPDVPAAAEDAVSKARRKG